MSVLSLVRPALLKLKPYSSARSLTTEGSIFLDANESPRPLVDGPFKRVNRYPEPQPRRILATAAEFYGAAPESILVCRGTDEGIEVLTRAVCEAGKDGILICPPTYGVYEVAAGIQGAGVVRAPLVGAPDFKLDLERMEAALRDPAASVKLLYVCTPNNPTGTVFPREDVLRLCRAAEGRALVVVDEAYLEFTREESLLAVREDVPNLVVLRTLSKAWALAGARCGFVFADPALIDVLQRVRAPYPMSAPSIQAVEAVFNAEGEGAMRRSVAAIVAEKEFLEDELAKLSGVQTVFGSAANFVLMKVARKDALLAAARAAGLVFRDRSADFGLEDCVRVTVGTADENAAALRCFREVLG